MADDRVPTRSEDEPQRRLPLWLNAPFAVSIVGAWAVVVAALFTGWFGPRWVEDYKVKLEETRKATAAATVVAADAAKSAQQSSAQVAQLQGATAGTLSQGQKLCRVMQNKQWKDGLIVPQAWGINLCVDYMKKSGGTRYQLGCVYTDGLLLGSEDGTIPSPNCGWN